jgi:hypothetical protein
VVSAAEPPRAVNLRFFLPEPLLFLSSSSSVIFTRLSGPQFQTYCYSENLAAPGIEPGHLSCRPTNLITILVFMNELISQLSKMFHEESKCIVRFEVFTAVTMKNAVPTSQETHYFSTTKFSQLMPYKI